MGASTSTPQTIDTSQATAAPVGSLADRGYQQDNVDKWQESMTNHNEPIGGNCSCAASDSDEEEEMMPRRFGQNTSAYLGAQVDEWTKSMGRPS